MSLSITILQLSTYDGIINLQVFYGFNKDRNLVNCEILMINKH